MRSIRHFTALAAFLVVVLIAGSQQQPHRLQFGSVTELQQFLSYSDKRVPLSSAHRGGPAKGFPENALETFQHSILFHPLIIECDDWSELQQLKLKDNTEHTTALRIPLPGDVLSVVNRFVTARCKEAPIFYPPTGRWKPLRPSNRISASIICFLRISCP